MLYILIVIIVLYTASHLVFGKNEIYLKLRKWIDLATIIVTSVLVITWVEVFNLSFLFVIYFFLSLSLIIYLFYSLRKLDIKKKKAEEVIKELKNEEKVLENEIDVLKNENN